MPRSVRATARFAPALGELRLLPTGSLIVLAPDVVTRKDWPRLIEAIGAAVGHGVSVQWEEPDAISMEDRARSDWRRGSV